MSKCYSELVNIPTMEGRYEYLKLGGEVGADSFGMERIFNQRFYRSQEWKRVRHQVIVRDNGCDMGLAGREIFDRPIVHHINPITINDLHVHSEKLFDLENLILVSYKTHNAIHYGNIEQIKDVELIERKPNDTCPWKGGIPNGKRL